jgi:hypothetical protein
VVTYDPQAPLFGVECEPTPYREDPDDLVGAEALFAEETRRVHVCNLAASSGRGQGPAITIRL